MNWNLTQKDNDILEKQIQEILSSPLIAEIKADLEKWEKEELESTKAFQKIKGENKNV